MDWRGLTSKNNLNTAARGNMDIPNLQLISGAFPPDLARHVATREAVLWVGTGFDDISDGSHDVARLVSLPWHAVLLETARGETARLIESGSATFDRFVRIRGFIHLIAENPADLVRSPRSLPVFMLNGRVDATDPAMSSSLTGSKAMLRRLTMVEEIRKTCPRMLVLLTDGSQRMLESVFELWVDSQFCPRIVILDPFDRCGPQIETWLKSLKQSVAVDRCVIPLHEAVEQLQATIESVLPDDRYIVRMLVDDQRTADIDLTNCDSIEAPLTDRFNVILARDLNPIAPADLTDAQINQFFEGSTNRPLDEFGRIVNTGWAAYSAGLPWLGRSDVVDVTFRALGYCWRHGYERNRIVLLPSEPGAGGTTLARLAAFAAARAGYPTLIAHEDAAYLKASEVVNYLTRAGETARQAAKSEAYSETPWLIVFDVAHWRGREDEAVRFYREMVRSGRPAVVLCVVENIADAFRLGHREVEVADTIRHDLSQEDAEELGRHLNRFLTPRNRAVPASDWISFWEKHSPLGTDVPASFWVALSFWLRRQLNLDDTIQNWLTRQLKSANIPNDAWAPILEIAALSIEREGGPEGLLSPLSTARQASEVLEEMKKAVPSLALHRVGYGDRVWYIAHDLLGRLFLNIVFYDREMLARVGLSDAKEPTHLRILLLRRISGRTALTRKAYQSLAHEFPVNLFKLDDGRLEFARYWTDVLEALDAMPPVLRNNRTYKHHVAITRRRICNIPQYFDLDAKQRQDLLRKAVELLEEALSISPVGADDESDLNIYNSLSLACQDLAEVEKELGADDARLSGLWKRATDAAQQAKQLNPRNSYVLETLARNLILTAKLFPEQGIEHAAEALGYVYEAMSLEKSDRQRKLLKFAQEAIGLLRVPAAIGRASRLAQSGNPFGHLALAWIHLAGPDNAEIEVKDLSAFPADRIESALCELAQVTDPNPLILQLQYHLTVAAQPSSFSEQLAILDALHLKMARMPLQLRMERAILLHQQNRHKEANELFDEVRRVNRDPANQEYVAPPPNLEWLYVRNEKSGRLSRRICDAKVTPRKGNYKNFAKVPQLLDAEVPFNPREFAENLPIGHRFKCYITFGHNGPLIKPAIGGEDVA